jgi:hypothetical protein
LDPTKQQVISKQGDKMSIKTVNPEYSARASSWTLMDDSYEGEEAIKRKGTDYLPSTSGQKEDGQGQGTSQEGEKAYAAYKMRSCYPTIFKDAVDAAVGLLHNQPPVINLPPQLEHLLDKASKSGLSLEQLLRSINARQLITGRIGVLADISGELASLALYNESSIINWSTDNETGELNLVVLDETDYEMSDDLSWEIVNKYLILFKDPESNTYVAGKFEEDHEFSKEQLEPPVYKGAVLESIPFVFINSSDICNETCQPPLSGLAHTCLSIYRGEADYRQNLFMQGQDTLVTIGEQDPDEATRTGAGAKLSLPQNGDAKYIGVNSQGLSEQRQSLENDYMKAFRQGSQLVETSNKTRESAEALKIRVAAQTTNLNQIAKAGAEGLEKVLKDIAKWYGADENAVSVTPNLDFGGDSLDGTTLVQIVQAKALGAPISDPSIHKWMREQGFTSEDYDVELELLSNEEPDIDVDDTYDNGDNDDDI